MLKNLPANAGDLKDEDSISGSGKSPGEGHGESHEQRSLAGYCPGGGTESDN